MKRPWWSLQGALANAVGAAENNKAAADRARISERMVEESPTCLGDQRGPAKGERPGRGHKSPVSGLELMSGFDPKRKPTRYAILALQSGAQLQRYPIPLILRFLVAHVLPGPCEFAPIGEPNCNTFRYFHFPR